MKRMPIPIEEFRVRPCHLWAKQWLLLAAGDFQSGRFNAMTVGWGGIGVMWSKPFVHVVVRPVRYTFEFMEKHETFTLSAFPEKNRPALALLGSKSGRDGDKIAEAGLTPMAASTVPAPAFDQAELILECRKMYWDDMNPARFLDRSIEENYPQQDYHRIFYGEILAISGTPAYR